MLITPIFLLHMLLLTKLRVATGPTVTLALMLTTPLALSLSAQMKVPMGNPSAFCRQPLWGQLSLLRGLAAHVVS